MGKIKMQKQSPKRDSRKDAEKMVRLVQRESFKWHDHKQRHAGVLQKLDKMDAS